jgi:hypothetical protein
MEGSVKFMNNIKWDASYKSLGNSVLGSFGCNSTVKDSILVATLKYVVAILLLLAEVSNSEEYQQLLLPVKSLF